MRKHTRTGVGALAALALIAAACGGEDVDETAAVVETPGVVETPDVDDTLGVVRVAAGEQIQIRSMEAITGDVAFLGVPNLRAVELAIADYGQIQGFGVSIGTALDSQCSAEGGQTAAQTIIADDKVVGVIGTSCSGAAVPASQLIESAGYVMLSASNTNPPLTQNPFGTTGDNFSDGYYRTAHNDLYQGSAVANFAYSTLGLRKAAAMHDGDPYTDGLATAFKEAFEALGGEVTIYTAVNKGDTDMVPVLTEIAASGPQIVFMPIFPPEVNRVAEQWNSVSGLADVVRFSADGAQVENFMEIKESEGFYFSGPNLQFESNKNEITDTSATEFLTAYRAAYGEAPSAAFWAHAYDAATMLLRAIDDVAVMDGDTLIISRQALRDAISAADFQGITGGVKCDAFGDCGAGEIQILLHTDSSVTDATQITPLEVIKP